MCYQAHLPVPQGPKWLTGAARCTTVLAVCPARSGDGTSDELACGFVGRHDDACGRNLAVDEPQCRWDGAVPEQALSRTDDDGIRPNPVEVDQVVADQRLQKVGAAVHLQLWPVALLERSDRLARVSLQQDRWTPTQVGSVA